MNKLFAFHKVNTQGQRKAVEIAGAFDELLNKLYDCWAIPIDLTDREIAIVRTKLEEACFFAKKVMALQENNQEKE